MKQVTIERIEAAAFTVPTDGPEADGTLRWDSTTIVVARTSAGGAQGLGYTYSHAAAAKLIETKLAEAVCGCDAMAVAAASAAMIKEVRNLGRPGLASYAISAVDTALWDLKARLLGLPLLTLLGAVRDAIPVYGSGGFTSYSIDRLQRQLGDWVAAGISRVKMKIGSAPSDDPDRVRAARAAIGPQAKLFVDANGAYDRKEALAQAEKFSEQGVSWFEEPVSSDDLAGLRLLRDRVPAGMEVAAGEYGYDLFIFGACWKPARSTCCRPMRRAAAASAASSRPARSAKPTHCRFRRIRRRRSTPISAALCRRRGILNISTITRGSSRCSSTVR